jgi:fructose/tagatose bisphosphate aldolase
MNLFDTAPLLKDQPQAFTPPTTDIQIDAEAEFTDAFKDLVKQRLLILAAQIDQAQDQEKTELEKLQSRLLDVTMIRHAAIASTCFHDKRLFPEHTDEIALLQQNLTAEDLRVFAGFGPTLNILRVNQLLPQTTSQTFVVETGKIGQERIFDVVKQGTDDAQRMSEVEDPEHAWVGALPIRGKEPIAYLVRYRDNQYMDAVDSAGTADIIASSEGLFTPGHDAYEAARKAKKALIATNIISFNQIAGHLMAAMSRNAGIILEVARSQLSYALDEIKTASYIKEIAQGLGFKNPLILHGDHTQYKEALFKQENILKEEYEKVKGQDTFSDDIDIESIDKAILESVQQRLREDSQKEREVITGIIERLIKAGFTSVAIDASTIFDEIAVEIVLDYYQACGSREEKLVVELEESFVLPLEWGVNLLKLNPDEQEDIAIFEGIRNKIVSDMDKRRRPKLEIAERVDELSSAFGILRKEARRANLNEEKVIAAYDKIMQELARVNITGEIGKHIPLSVKQKLLLLPTSNAEETAYQIEQINSLLAQHKPELLGHFGIEVEVGHVDRKVPNPRRQGAMEAKMTHPQAVKVMGDHLASQGLSFDLIATNNGSGHGTEFDKETLTPISQVGKISPFLTAELQEQASAFGVSIAQHGTSGSDMDELAELFKRGVTKFNIATNYQQIILNVLSLIDDGLQGEQLLERCIADRDALVDGLHKDTREKLKQMAHGFKEGALSSKIEDGDSLFAKLIKCDYEWGVKKGKIKDASSEKDIATVFAKEFKRVFSRMDEDFRRLAYTGVYFSALIQAWDEGRLRNDIFLLSGMTQLIRPLLERAVSGADEEVRARAIGALGRIGCDDERVVEVLEKGKKSGERRIEASSERALKAIEESVSVLKKVEEATGEKANDTPHRYLELEDINLPTFIQLYLSHPIPLAQDLERIVAVAERVHGSKEGLPTILEVGAGKGLLAYLLARTGRVKIEALDFEPAVKFTRFQHPNLTFKAGNIKNYKGKVDLVLCAWMGEGLNLTPFIRDINAPCIVYVKDVPWLRTGFTFSMRQSMEEHQDADLSDMELSYEPGENYRNAFNWQGYAIWGFDSDEEIKENAEYIVQLRRGVEVEGLDLLQITSPEVYPYEVGLKRMIEHQRRADADDQGADLVATPLYHPLQGLAIYPDSVVSAPDGFQAIGTQDGEDKLLYFKTLTEAPYKTATYVSDTYYTQSQPEGLVANTNSTQDAINWLRLKYGHYADCLGQPGSSW